MKNKRKKLINGCIDMSHSKSWYAKRKPEKYKDRIAQNLYKALHETQDQETKIKIKKQIRLHFLSL